MKKKVINVIVVLFLLVTLSMTVCATEEKPDISNFTLPKPQAPVYLMFDAADRTEIEGNDALYVVRQTDMKVLELSAEEYSDREAFLEKYGLYNFTIIMQYDTSLDGMDNWNYTPEWDNEYSAPSAYEACPIAWIGAEMMGKENIFDLYAKDPENENYSKMADAIIQRDVSDGDNTFNNFYFDYENHSLYIRCRYYMEWETYDGETIGERQSKYSEWSDAAVFGKDGAVVVPEEPTGYEAPIISNLKYVQPDEGHELGYLTYTQLTPEQVWMSGIYYEMTDGGSFEGLETEISINDGEWQYYNTSDSWGDWCLWNGERTAYSEEPRIEKDSHIKLRVRFAGTQGYSEWSNVLELNGGGTQEVSESMGAQTTEKPAVVEEKPVEDKCTLCGFCPVPLGLCIFIWLLIILAIVVIAAAIIIIKRPKKCKKCGAKRKDNEKFCSGCGAPIQ